MPRLDDDALDHLAALARLELAAEDRPRLRDDLERVLTYVDRLEAFDDPATPPLRHPAHDGAPLDPAALRADVERPAVDAPGPVLDPALERRDGRVVVPRTIDADG